MASKKRSKSNGEASKPAAKADSVLLAARFHGEEADIVRQYAAKSGKSVGAIIRLAVVPAACESLGESIPDLPEFSAGRGSAVSAAARAKGMTPAEFRKAAVDAAVASAFEN